MLKWSHLGRLSAVKKAQSARARAFSEVCGRKHPQQALCVRLLAMRPLDSPVAATSLDSERQSSPTCWARRRSCAAPKASCKMP